jgi:hypothetical protein
VCVPCRVVAGWIGAVKLVSHYFVIASVHEGDTEGSTTSELGQSMFPVRNVFDDLFDVDGSMHCVELLLANETACINEVVSVGNNTRYSAHYVFIHLVKFA